MGKVNIQQASEVNVERTDRFLRRKQTVNKIGISETTLDEWIAQGKFPTPIKLGARSVAFLKSELNEWMRQRVIASRNNGAAA